MIPEKRQEVQRRLEEAKKNTGFGRNVLPPPKVESESSSYYSSDDEKKPGSDGSFSPPKPGGEITAPKRVLEVSRPGRDKRTSTTDRRVIPMIKPQNLVKPGIVEIHKVSGAER